jgi:hypothetical protein
MKTMVEAHVPCWVIVGIGTERKIVVVPFSEVPPTGNWTAAEFLALRKVLAVHPYDEIPKMIADMFAHSASAYRGRHNAT